MLSSQEINWDDAKNQIEILYSSIPGFTLDLYQLKVNQEDILSFNKEFDNLSVAAKEENKENTLASLAKLYSYIPKFFNETEGDKVKGNLIEIKSYVFNAYSKLDSDDWETIKTNINSASNLYSNLLTNVEIKSNDQYNINKGYVLLNEINNAIELKDVSIFLIKYKNLLEQIGNI